MPRSAMLQWRTNYSTPRQSYLLPAFLSLSLASCFSARQANLLEDACTCLFFYCNA
ncbi:hypothetical protein K450DRAFT_261052 [Umbelopsis ramanniana AG]|uniref:Lipoprotein n=1 Tax=Umbelopsis ramanniana AG TaxID=1314678 RepID=A0AAD5E2C4_UMBRA|nr:uncharacterized protein K450DRAFT_261052 [Umbelopsis ramanniana AG]KAI8575587.1 hypothetical protein K450DRAFT_261052 [Umbelopsis ramanniana AG]